MTDVAERLRAMAEWQVLDTHGQWARDGADEIDALRAAIDRHESAAREAAQVLIAEVGADGPMSVLDAAHRAVARINKLIARNAGLFTELSVTMEEHARIKGLIKRGEVGR